MVFLLFNEGYSAGDGASISESLALIDKAMRHPAIALATSSAEEAHIRRQIDRLSHQNV